MITTKTIKWDIGHYYSDDSICVNVEVDGKSYHRHDNGNIMVPRSVRLGLAIESLEIEAGLVEYRKQLHEQYQKDLKEHPNP